MFGAMYGDGSQLFSDNKTWDEMKLEAENRNGIVAVSIFDCGQLKRTIQNADGYACFSTGVLRATFQSIPGTREAIPCGHGRHETIEEEVAGYYSAEARRQNTQAEIARVKKLILEKFAAIGALSQMRVEKKKEGKVDEELERKSVHANTEQFHLENYLKEVETEFESIDRGIIVSHRLAVSTEKFEAPPRDAGPVKEFSIPSRMSGALEQDLSVWWGLPPRDIHKSTNEG